MAQAPQPEPPASSATPATILLAEDERTIRDFLERALIRAGYAVISVATGADAVARGHDATQPIDLLVADVMMPGMSGLQAADALRHAHPRMRTLFLSGYSLHSGLPAGLEPAEFLQKPFTLAVLLAKVRERLAAPE
jgi:DNA-binding response OmpR family regulator